MVSRKANNDDMISIEFKDHELFIAIQDDFLLAENYTVLTSVLNP